MTNCTCPKNFVYATLMGCCGHKASCPTHGEHLDTKENTNAPSS